MADSSPTVRQRELGLRLRKIRTGLGLTVEDVAEKLMCSAAKVSRLETGARRPVLRDIRDLCTLYALDAKATSELMELTKQARMRAWWDEYDDLNLVPYIGLEQEASVITAYGLLWLPGLLQTEDYARAIIRAIAPHIGQEVQEERVQARMRRQQLLVGDNPPRYRALIDEAAVRRVVGGESVMAAQVDKVLQAARDGQAVVQIIPFDSGAYGAADIMFVLLEFTDQPPLVFVEDAVGPDHHVRPDIVQQYRDTIEIIRDSALSPRDTMRYLEELKQVYDGARHAQLPGRLITERMWMSTFPAAAENFQWRVASMCESGACVGVARQGEFIFIGNTNDSDAPVSRFTPLEWKTFIAGVKLGDFDDITE